MKRRNAALIVCLLTLTSLQARERHWPSLPDACVDNRLVGNRDFDEAFTAELPGYQCRVHNISKSGPFDQGTHNEVWYTSDGSCLVRSNTPEASYNRLKQWLTTPSNYNSIDQVLEFKRTNNRGVVLAENQQGRINLQALQAQEGQAENLTRFEPFRVFIGLKGLGVGALRFHFRYYFENRPEERIFRDGDTLEGKEFVINWETDPTNLPMPRALQRRPLSDNGRQLPRFLNRKLDRVVGQWRVKLHLEENARDSWICLRYFTSADILGMNFTGRTLNSLNNVARPIHLNTLRHIAAVGRGK